MMGLQRDDIDAYDSKSEPVAQATAALVAMNNAGWTVIRKYFPQLGNVSAGPERRVDPGKQTDNRFFAAYATEDVAFSPIPLLCMVWSLPEPELSGRLKAFHEEIAPAMVVEDYSTWTLDDLRKSIDSMTNPAKTVQGTKYRTPKSNLSFQQALRLYVMTLALLKAETKWTGKTDSPPPDMNDFTNRLRQQLPRPIGDGETTAFFLYRPGVVNHPLSKDEFEERADVVWITRKGTTFEVEQFPVYLTEEQKEWSPAWIQPEDEQNDTTLIARKFEHDWTRLDGPFLWFRGDQFNGQVTYQATVELNANEIVIEAERMIESRGAVKRVRRPPDYDPKLMTAFQAAVDTPASSSDALSIDPPRIEDAVNNLKRLGPYFSNSFRAWCAYGTINLRTGSRRPHMGCRAARRTAPRLTNAPVGLIIRYCHPSRSAGLRTRCSTCWQQPAVRISRNHKTTNVAFGPNNSAHGLRIKVFALPRLRRRVNLGHAVRDTIRQTWASPLAGMAAQIQGRSLRTMRRLRVCLSLLVALSLLLIAAGCGGGSTNNNSGSGSGSNPPPPPPPPSAPTISNFAVSPTLVAPGQFTNFSWTTANATGFTVTPNITQDDQGNLPLNATAYSYNSNGLTQTTTFQATASSGSTNSKPKSVTLSVVPLTLSASATMIQAGQNVVLTYGGPNNSSTWSLVTVGNNNPTQLPAPSSCNGNTCTATYQTSPLSANTTFQVVAAGTAGGQAYSPQVAITVGNPTTVTLTANPTTVQSGGATTLTWTSTSASAVAITCSPSCNPAIGQVGLNGSTTQNPTQTTTYTATATSIYPGAPPVIATATVTVSTGGIGNLNHIIFMVQENRAFDNYFGVLAQYRVNHQPPIQGAQLSDVNDLHTLPSGYQICNPQGGCFAPFHARTECIENLSPSWDETHYDMDLVGDDWLNLTQNSQFLMDKFLWTTLSGGSGDKYDPTHSRPLGYYDQTDLPYYYELATQFTTDDQWRSPIPANTIPNRMYLFAATSYGHAFPPPQNDPSWQQPTIFRAMQNAGVTWRYYYQDNSVFLANWADWNDPQIQANVRNIQEYYNILASPNADKELPEVIFIERASATGLDEHPGNNVQTGAVTAQNAINALMASAAWPDSVFILTWDEGGGLFDHVGPIMVTPPGDFLEPTDLQKKDQTGEFNVTGFRVPMVVVSPWSKKQTVVHLQTDYTSILKLIETRFNVPALTQRDANTQDMADPTNGFFDFTSPQWLTPPTLPTQPTNGTCNYQLEGSPQ